MQGRLEAGAVAREILVTGGVGRGSTRLTAFDAALQDAGIHEANLIPVSSITPASAETRYPEPDALAETIRPGEYFPAVYAWEASDEPEDRVHAAVAGARLGAGHGINVEDHGVNERPTEVEPRCRRMLGEMADRRDTSIDGDPWIRLETTRVAGDADWAAAVAAILYAR